MKRLDNTPKFWLGIQGDYNIEEEMILKEKELNNIKVNKILLPE